MFDEILVYLFCLFFKFVFDAFLKLVNGIKDIRSR